MDKATFKAACLSGLPLAEWAKGRDAQTLAAMREKWCPSLTCRGCGLPLTDTDFDVWVSYWKSVWFPAHKACRAAGMAEEAYDCQCVDADCNDCNSFCRGKSAGELVMIGVAGSPDVTRPANGHCEKFDRPAVAWANFCSGWACFEHRKGK